MSNSKLVSYTRWSPNRYTGRTFNKQKYSIDRITPHCVVGQCSIETLGAIFAPSSRQASCQYGIGSDGRIGQYVSEADTSWCSSSRANDVRSVTIECASNTYDPYWMNDKVWKSLIKLCVDICKRNKKKKLLWLGSKSKALNYKPKSAEMVLTCHRWFAQKSCPGGWLYNRLGKLATEVTKQLSGDTFEPYKVKITANTLVVRKSASKSSKKVGELHKNEVYTIVAVDSMEMLVSEVVEDTGGFAAQPVKMDVQVISQTLALVIQCATIITLIYTLIKFAGKPNHDQNERLDKVEKRLDEVEKRLGQGDSRFDRMDEGNRYANEALLALLEHGIDGNHTEKMIQAKEHLQNYLISK